MPYEPAPHYRHGASGIYGNGPQGWSALHQSPVAHHAPHYHQGQPNHHYQYRQPGSHSYNDSNVQSPSQQHVSDMDRLYRRSRRRYPPSPSVEDEVASLAKEYPPQWTKSEDDVESRGTIDQDPLVIELCNHERRYVVLSDEYGSSAKDKEERERRKADWKKRQSNGPELKLDTNTTENFPNLDRRAPTPYSYSKSSTPAALGKEYFLSPEEPRPAKGSIPRSMPTENGFNALKKAQRLKKESSDSSSSYRSEYSDESDVDAKEALRRRRTHEARSARTSFNEPPPPLGRHTSFGGTSSSKPISSLREDLSRAALAGTAAAIAAKVGSKVLHEEGQRHASKSSSSGHGKSRPSTSRRGTDSVYGSSPRSSGNLGSSVNLAASPPPSPLLRNIQSAGSPNGSRPESPQSPYEPFPFEPSRGKYERSTSYTIPLHPKPGPASRLSSYQQPSSPSMYDANPRIDVSSPSPNPTPYPMSSVPYPLDNNFIAMPNEAPFQAMADGLKPSSAQHREPSPRPSSIRSHKSASPRAQQSDPRSSSGNISPLSSDSEADRPRTATRRSTVELPPNPPEYSPCPRTEFTKGKNDWRTLRHSKNFHVCPNCYFDIVRPTSFRSRFHAAPPISPSRGIRCDFGNAWVRMAWLLMIKQQKDEECIYGLSKIIDGTDICPADGGRDPQFWGLESPDGIVSSAFFICDRDKSFAEYLFPSFNGVFVPVRSRGPLSCATRGRSKRLGQYLDILDAIHNQAVRNNESYSRPKADPSPLIELAKAHAGNIPCEKDKPLPGASWYIIPELPVFTVCPECYNSQVAPKISSGSRIASKFLRSPSTPPPLSSRLSSNMSHSEAAAHSCQLYSPRMRDIWTEVCAKEDMRLLERKATDRKANELHIRQNRAEYSRMLGMVDSSSRYGSLSGPFYQSGSGIDKEQLKRALRNLELNWEEVE
jgi:hypothetical protein